MTETSRPTRWWEQPRAFGKLGDIAHVKGSNVTIECPKCHEQPVVYNGNYFCDGFGLACNWALAHPATSKKDRKVCDLIGIDYG